MVECQIPNECAKSIEVIRGKCCPFWDFAVFVVVRRCTKLPPKIDEVLKTAAKREAEALEAREGNARLGRVK